MGRGYLQFKLVNMRAPVVFGFFQGGTSCSLKSPRTFTTVCILTIGLDDATLVAVSDTVTFKNYDEPLQGHLALTGDPTEMV